MGNHTEESSITAPPPVLTRTGGLCWVVVGFNRYIMPCPGSRKAFPRRRLQEPRRAACGVGRTWCNDAAVNPAAGTETTYFINTDGKRWDWGKACFHVAYFHAAVGTWRNLRKKISLYFELIAEKFVFDLNWRVFTFFPAFLHFLLKWRYRSISGIPLYRRAWHLRRSGKNWSISKTFSEIQPFS